jgi:hypothetical protein
MSCSVNCTLRCICTEAVRSTGIRIVQSRASSSSSGSQWRWLRTLCSNGKIISGLMRCSLLQCYTLVSVGTVPAKIVHIGGVVLPHLASESGVNSGLKTKFVNRVSCTYHWLQLVTQCFFRYTYIIFVTNDCII